MRVLVTGGTGFVGAHTVQALVAVGHEVRLLVRSPARIAENLGPLGVPEVDFAVGDMTDADAVGMAMDGCDAVLHGAAVVALDRRRADEILAANPAGARVVVGTAVERGLDPIVYVSSVARSSPPASTACTPSSRPPVATTRTAARRRRPSSTSGRCRTTVRPSRSPIPGASSVRPRAARSASSPTRW